MPVAEFFAWLERMPELMRQEALEAINQGVIIGQRSVGDSDYKEIMRKMSRPYVPAEKRMSKKEFEEFADKVEELNKLMREINAAQG